tara:strand:- start:120 stop:464 length:345 start_codon:yes stop_codon:yes gene_type:complete
MEHYIFYMKFETKIMPIYCTGIVDDPLIDGHYLFTGVKHLDDKAFPALRINSISLPKADIKYYLKGLEEELTEELAAELSEVENITAQQQLEEEDSEDSFSKFHRRRRMSRKSR